MRDDTDEFYSAVMFMLIWLNISGMGFWVVIVGSLVYGVWGVYWGLAKCGLLGRDPLCCIER